MEAIRYAKLSEDERKDHRKRDREAHRRSRGGSIDGLLMDKATNFISELSLLTDADLGYIAGLVDGEGSITIHRVGDKAGRNANAYVNCSVSIANTSIDMIEWLTQALPTSRVKWQKKIDPRFNSTKPVARWYVCGRRAAALCQAIEPYLRTIKRLKARLLRMMLAELPHNGRVMPSEEVERRVRLLEQFKALGN